MFIMLARSMTEATRQKAAQVAQKEIRNAQRGVAVKKGRKAKGDGGG